MADARTLSCPKCGESMRSYERSGVTMDQCMGCRGVFLDRGELERLVDAEGAYYGAGGDRGPSSRPFEPQPGSRHGDHGKKPGRRGFLGELFD